MGAVQLAELNDRWSRAKAAERANFQSYLIELCDAIEVARPQPAGSGYEFELPLQVVTADGTTTTRFADLSKEACFLLEAKDAEEGKSTDLLLRRAFGQVTQYAAFLPNGHPPYLLVLDVGATLLVWDRWGGTYGGFQAARRIDLKTLHTRPDDIALLRDIFTNPAARDPRERANAVTKDIAGKLAGLASGLEAGGHAHEAVARFLMRCVFTMFAEDVGLLPGEPFKGAVEIGLEDPAEFASAVRELWTAMDEGRRFGLKKLLRFNGHFFKDRDVLAMSRSEMAILAEAAKADWAHVEPTIFGTLLVRALDPVERHRLGAEYTPREFVERLVRPTIEEPVREQWTLVQAEVLQLRERGRPIDNRRATARLRSFLVWLRGLRVLDPACGSGNFLYVALATLKSIELEVLREIEAITGMPELPVEEVSPAQFHGIEVKPWARELAELTLWVGYYQWWRRTHGHTLPPEPVLRDTGTLECRDAVLAWDDVVHVPEKDRADPTPRVEDPVTGRLVPDRNARLRYLEYRGARQAEWPEADFIVGNPPYIGSRRLRDALGDGYAEALREAYRGEVPDDADFVMYWWHRAAMAVASGRTIRAGLITTSSITQARSRRLIQAAEAAGAGVTWAIANHPWVDETDGAAVRVAMTVLAAAPQSATLVTVNDDAEIVAEVRRRRLNHDLSAHADVSAAAASALRANAGLSSQGYILVGSGFILEPEEAARLLGSVAQAAEVIRPYLTGSDLTKRRGEAHVIDFALRSEEEARAYPVLFDLVRDRVKPRRDSTKREGMRLRWWLFGEPRSTFRPALGGLSRMIVTSEVAKHRAFFFVPAETIATNTTVLIALDDAFHLGVLSSRIHIEWALAAGGRMGVGNDPRYNKSTCFDPFPFPDADTALRARVAELAERIEAHRKDALARDERTTITALYNVVEKLRSGEALTTAERRVQTSGACGVLRDLQDELDGAVAEAYGWPWPMEKEAILDRLVALHEERAREEQGGLVRWLRRDYQQARFGAGTPDEELTLEEAGAEGAAGLHAQALTPWPSDVLPQLALVRDLVSARPRTMTELTALLEGARPSEVRAHLDALAVLGVLHQSEDGRYHPAAAASTAAAA